MASNSVVRAFGSHPRGREFESLQVHQHRKTAPKGAVFLCWRGALRRGLFNEGERSCDLSPLMCRALTEVAQKNRPGGVQKNRPGVSGVSP